MKLLITLVGLVLILEGLPYVACPKAMQDWLRQLIDTDPKILRTMGVIAMAIGFALCYVTQRTELLP